MKKPTTKQKIAAIPTWVYLIAAAAILISIYKF